MGTHVNGFRPELFHGAIDNAIGADAVNLDGSGWLGMYHLGEDGTDNDPIFGIKKLSTKFSFGGRI